MDKDTQVKVVYKNNKLKAVYLKYKKETPFGFIWNEDELEDLSDVIEINRGEYYQGKPTVIIKTYGKLEEVFQQ